MTTKSHVVPWITVVCRCGEIFAVPERLDEKHPGLDSPGVTWRCGNPECKTTYKSLDILAKIDRWGRAEFGSIFAEPEPPHPPMSAYDQKLRE